jgi:SAM-dependent methyltransferase
MAMYSKVGFWDNRYRANEVPYEWYQGYGSLRHLLNPIYFASSMSSHPSYGPQGARPPEGGGGGAAAMTDGMDGGGALGALGGGGRAGGYYPAASAAPPSGGGGGSSRPLFPPREAARTLILGCGNATFGEDMQRDGWTGRIVNVDFSSVVIDQMRAKYGPALYQKGFGAGLPGGAPPMMEWLLADITRPLPFEAGSFDLIVCKGSFDAVLCGAGSRFSILRVVRECVRLLAPETGIFFLVTHGNPDSRVEYLEYENDLYHYWSSVQVHTVARPIAGMPGPYHPNSYGVAHHPHAFPPPR